MSAGTQRVEAVRDDGNRETDDSAATVVLMALALPWHDIRFDAEAPPLPNDAART